MFWPLIIAGDEEEETKQIEASGPSSSPEENQASDGEENSHTFEIKDEAHIDGEVAGKRLYEITPVAVSAKFMSFSRNFL